MPTPEVSLWLRGYDLIIKPDAESALTTLEKLAFVKRDISEKEKRIYHSLPINFSQLAKVFPDAKLFFEDDALWSVSLSPHIRIKPRDYQEEAHKAWLNAGKKGVIVLPTGAGKTVQALLAISELKCSSLIVVPTIDLLHQWKSSLVSNLSLAEEDVGVLGGGLKEIKSVTVTTYDSALIHMKKLQLFKLVVFDEVHHLPAETYRHIALGLVAPFRMGLSATPERVDELHKDLPYLVGDVVFRKTHEAVKEHIARFRLERIDVDLTEEEVAKYKENMGVYRKYMFRKRLFFFGKNAYQRLIYLVGKDKEAYAALLAFQEARKIALNAEKKLGFVFRLLEKHQDDKVILFSEFNSVVDAISREFLIPEITHITDKAERRAILGNFRAGIFSKIVTGRVLDEGVDVPDASVGIIVSGSGSERAYIQRLGRILRPKDKEAVLYELVTSKTLEMRSARKRKKGVVLPSV